MTKGKFGFHRCGGEVETGTAAELEEIRIDAKKALVAAASH